MEEENDEDEQEWKTEAEEKLTEKDLRAYPENRIMGILQKTYSANDLQVLRKQKFESIEPFKKYLPVSIGSLTLPIEQSKKTPFRNMNIHLHQQKKHWYSLDNVQ